MDILPLILKSWYSPPRYLHCKTKQIRSIRKHGPIISHDTMTYVSMTEETDTHNLLFDPNDL